MQNRACTKVMQQYETLKQHETKGVQWSVMKHVIISLIIPVSPLTSIDRGWLLCGSIRISSSPSSTSSRRCRFHGMLWDAVGCHGHRPISAITVPFHSRHMLSRWWFGWFVMGLIYDMIYKYMAFRFWLCLGLRIWSSKKRSRLWLQRPDAGSLCRRRRWRASKECPRTGA